LVGKDAMNLSLWLDNLVAYSLQIGALVAAGTLLQRILRIRVPAILLLYWRVLLMACLFLPALQPWRTVMLGPARFAEAPSSPVIAIANQPIAPSASFFTYRTAGVILAVGMVLRLLWLSAGLLRLNSYLRNARLLAALPAAVEDMQARVGIRPNVAGPGTSAEM